VHDRASPKNVLHRGSLEDQCLKIAGNGMGCKEYIIVHKIDTFRCAGAEDFECHISQFKLYSELDTKSIKPMELD